MVVKWQGTTSQGGFIYTCKRFTIQAHHGCKSEIYGTHDTKA